VFSESPKKRSAYAFPRRIWTGELQGINKPAVLRHQFLNRWAKPNCSARIRRSGVCTDKSGGIQVLVWDFTLTHPRRP